MNKNVTKDFIERYENTYYTLLSMHVDITAQTVRYYFTVVLFVLTGGSIFDLGCGTEYMLVST